MLALIFFVLRPMARPPADVELAELTGPRELRRPAAPLGAAAGGGDILDLPPQTVTKIERLREVIASRGEESAAVLRSWIEIPDTPQGARRIMSAFRLESFVPGARAAASAATGRATARSRPRARRPTTPAFSPARRPPPRRFLADQSRLTSELVEAIERRAR